MTCKRFEELTRGVRKWHDLDHLSQRTSIALFRHMKKCKRHARETLSRKLARAIGENYFGKGDPEKGIPSIEEGAKQLLEEAEKKGLIIQK